MILKVRPRKIWNIIGIVEFESDVLFHLWNANILLNDFLTIPNLKSQMMKFPETTIILFW